MIEFLFSTLRSATPLGFAALGGLLSERGGVINIALEGMMLVGAFTAATVASLTGDPVLAFFVGGVAGAFLGLLYAVFAIFFQSNQIVAGTAINLLALGLCPFFGKLIFDSSGSTPMLPIESRLSSFPIYVLAAVVVALVLFLKKTSAGLYIEAAGEEPRALHVAGISVRTIRLFSVTASGFLAGLGGATLSIALSSSFSKNMTAGRGFIALSALIFGKWKPIPAVLACLLFGASEALQVRVQGVVLWGESAVPVQFIQILPYVVTMIVLAGFVGKSRSPKNLGVPFNE